MDKYHATIAKDTVQSITFDPAKFTPEEAKKWLTDQGYEILDFVEAQPEKTAGKAPSKVAATGPAKTTRKTTRKN